MKGCLHMVLKKGHQSKFQLTKGCLHSPAKYRAAKGKGTCTCFGVAQNLILIISARLYLYNFFKRDGGGWFNHPLFFTKAFDLQSFQ